MMRPDIRNQITTMRWIMPLTFTLAFLIYELLLERWLIDAFGDLVHVVSEVILFGASGPLLLFLVMTYIDRWLLERQRMEKMASANERRLASITSASADAILGLDSDGRIESWNLGAELLFGYTEVDIQVQPFATLFSKRAAAQVELDWLFQYIRQNGFIRGHETTCQTADGRELIVELTATHLTDSQGGPLGTAVILRDITSRKQREKEIRRLNANLNAQVADRTRELAGKVEELAHANTELQKLDQMRSEFVSLVSHQIRAPLTNMNGAVQRMQADCLRVNPTCTRMFSIFEQQISRLDRLVQDVLNAARIETGQLVIQPEPMSVLPVVRQVVEQIRARTIGRPIRLPTKPGLPLVLADRDRVTEVLANLLDNADKYSPPGQEVSVEVRANETDVIISVRDWGPGLPAEDIEWVFDKFYRTDSSDAQHAYGYGLGLYVCRRLIEAQNGRIWAENHPHGGAVFSFMLPVWQGNHG
jgi:PAS domain S-box-containing protein